MTQNEKWPPFGGRWINKAEKVYLKSEKYLVLSQIDGFFGYFCPPTNRLFVNPELSDASQSEYPASLSYPMATFSANNFGHFGFYLMLNPVGPESIHIHFCYAVV